MCGRLFSVLVFVFAEIVALQHTDSGRSRGTRARHETHANASSDPRRSYLDHLDFRFTRLEAQVDKQSEIVRSELRENNRRLQTLEWQNADVHTSLDTFRNELARLTETGRSGYSSPRTSNNLDLKIDNLVRGFQVVVATLRGINVDIETMKTNISRIAESTKSLVVNHRDIVTKSFLSDELTDVRHRQPSRASSRLRIVEEFPENCMEVLERDNNVSGIYRIRPEWAPRAFMVLCDMETRGGGWTYIHNRYEGGQDFYLNWRSYKLGFGNLGGEFWLGLEYLHQLTGYEVNELLVELVDLEGKRVHAHYGAFSVGSEVEGYPLKVLGGYSGDAGDSLIYHAGNKFSTKDMDQDEWPEGSCAQAHTGAWWYRNCDTSNLNGRYLNGQLPEDQLYQGMYWGGFRGPQYSLPRARMMVRPRDNSRSALPSNILNNGN